MTVSKGVGNQIIISYLQKCADRARLVSLTSRPIAYPAQGNEQLRIRRQEEVGASVRSPNGKLIGNRDKFISDLLDAKDSLCRIVCDQPVPKAWTKVQSIMKILRLDEYVRVKEIGHYAMTPRLRPNF